VKLQEVNRLHCLIKLAAPVGTTNPTDSLLEHGWIEKGVLNTKESVHKPDLGSLGRAFN
jgi:hypothetical protein